MEDNMDDMAYPDGDMLNDIYHMIDDFWVDKSDSELSNTSSIDEDFLYNDWIGGRYIKLK